MKNPKIDDNSKIKELLFHRNEEFDKFLKSGKIGELAAIAETKTKPPFETRYLMGFSETNHFMVSVCYYASMGPTVDRKIVLKENQTFKIEDDFLEWGRIADFQMADLDIIEAAHRLEKCQQECFEEYELWLEGQSND